MNEKRFIDCVCTDARLPAQAQVLAVRPFGAEEHRRRLRRLVSATAEACQRSLDRADWVDQGDRTLARLPDGAYAEVFHASGAMRLSTGLKAMDALFERPVPGEELQSQVQSMAKRLQVDAWMGPRSSLAFERLWQIKAAAADRQEKVIEPVLCRAVGAFRQSVGELPVFGAASVAVKMAGGGQLDSVSLQLLETQGEAMETASLVPVDEAARQVYQQLESLMGRSKMPVSEMKLQAEPLRLGYVHLGKRKAQRLLAPHFLAAVRIEGEEVQAYQFIVPATQRTFVPLCFAGQQPPVPALRKAA